MVLPKSQFLLIALLMAGGEAFAAGRPLALNEKIAKADAVILGWVSDVDQKVYSVTTFQPGSGGSRVTSMRFFDLGMLHCENVLKCGDPAVKRPDAAEPAPKMFFVFRTPGQPAGGIEDGGAPSAKVGERRIWFLIHDRAFTGSYVLFEVEKVDDDTIGAINKLLAGSK